MRRATPWQPRGKILAVSWVVVFALAACKQEPPQAQPGTFTSVPVAGEVAPPQAGNGNAAAAANIVMPAAVPAAGAMTLTPKSNPYVCLTATAVAAMAPVTLTTCAGDSRQQWLLRDGRLMASQNLCLDADPNLPTLVGSAPKLIACDANQPRQVIGRTGAAGLVLVAGGIPVALAAQLPTAGNSNVTWQNIDGNSTAQMWALGADTAASGTLNVAGVQVTPSANRAYCLTGDSNGVIYSMCRGTPNQAWRWDAQNQLTVGGNCLDTVAGGLLLSPCTAAPSQRWYSLYGSLMPLGAEGCLNTETPQGGGPGIVSVLSCASITNPLFTFGAPVSAAVGDKPTSN